MYVTDDATNDEDVVPICRKSFVPEYRGMMVFFSFFAFTIKVVPCWLDWLLNTTLYLQFKCFFVCFLIGKKVMTKTNLEDR